MIRRLGKTEEWAHWEVGPLFIVVRQHGGIAFQLGIEDALDPFFFAA